jgi:hypothetical protein
MSRESQAARLSISLLQTRQAGVADRVPAGWEHSQGNRIALRRLAGVFLTEPAVMNETYG